MATFTFKKPSFTNTTNNYTDSNDSNKKWNMFISFAKYDSNDNIHFYLKGFKWQDSHLVEYASNHLAKVVTGGTSSEIVVKHQNLEDFLNTVPNIINELKKKGGYSERTYKELDGQFQKFIESTPTIEEIKEVQDNISNNWRDLLIRLKDPNNRDNFLKFQASREYMRRFGGEPLSEKNIAEVLMADPQATFVTNAYTWRTVFNRRIIGNPTKILISKPVYKYVSKNALDNAARQTAAGDIQFSNYKDAQKKSNNNNQVLFGIKKRAAQYEISSNSFYKDKVIDVRFTEPIDANNDPFMQVAGLVDNLKGELNQVALKSLAELGDEEIKAQINKKLEIDDTKSSLFQKFNKFLENKCLHLDIKISQTGDAVNDLVTNLYNYGMKLAESYNNLTPKSKSLFANILCATVGLTLKIPNTLKMQQAWNAIETMQPDDLENIIMRSFQAYKSMVSFNSEYNNINEDFAMNQAIHPMNFTEFKNVLIKNNKNIQSSITNDFNNLLNRMDKVGSDEYYDFDKNNTFKNE